MGTYSLLLYCAYLTSTENNMDVLYMGVQRLATCGSTSCTVYHNKKKPLHIIYCNIVFGKAINKEYIKTEYIKIKIKIKFFVINGLFL